MVYEKMSSLGINRASSGIILATVSHCNGEKGMSISRRQLIKNTTLAAAAPGLLGLGISHAQASPSSGIDFSMGFPEGSVLLNRNENPLGPSPKAIAAANEGIPLSGRYADSVWLRARLADHLGVDKDRILVGTGSGELLKLAPLVLARDGGNLVSSSQTYLFPPRWLERLGGTVKWVDAKKENDYRYDVKDLLNAVDSDTRILYLVSPNNPTGESVDYETLKSVADGLPKHVLFLVDEAYTEYETEAPKTGLDLIKEGYENVLVTRTFSKAHGLAGLRCGYGIGNPDLMKKLAQFGCGPTSTNMAGFGAAAASLEDDSHVVNSRAFMKTTRAYYEENFDKLGIKYLSGCPSFIMAELGDRVDEINQVFREKKIFVRPGVEWSMPEHVRISYGHEHENQTFFSVLKNLV
jgi:histidinol-phosphate aminotransferase